MDRIEFEKKLSKLQELNVSPEKFSRWSNMAMNEFITNISPQHQSTIAIEELGELQHELSEPVNSADRIGVLEELADTMIIIEEVKMIYDIYDIDIENTERMIIIDQLRNLQHQLCKEIRGISNEEELTKQLAMASIMVEGIKKIYGISDQDAMKAQIVKLKRGLSKVDKK